MDEEPFPEEPSLEGKEPSLEGNEPFDEDNPSIRLYEDNTINARTLSRPLIDANRPSYMIRPTENIKDVIGRIREETQNIRNAGPVSSSPMNYSNAYASEPLIVHEPKDGTATTSFYNLNNVINGYARASAANISLDSFQKRINSLITFRYNSVNIVIGRRGSGKTYTTLREILKLFLVDRQFGGGYTQIFYITDKTYDDTVAMFEPLFPKNMVTFTWVPTDKAYELIMEISRAKSLLAQLIKKVPGDDLDYEIDESRLREKVGNGTATDEDKEFVDAMDELWYESAKASGFNVGLFAQLRNELHAEHLPLRDMPHTILIFDDCIGLFKKDSPLAKKCYENRQMRATIFMLLQDVQGISPSMKSNADSITLFSGFSKQKWNTLFYQLPPGDFAYDDYKRLQSGDALFIDYDAVVKSPGDNETILKRDGGVNKRIR